MTDFIFAITDVELYTILMLVGSFGMGRTTDYKDIHEDTSRFLTFVMFLFFLTLSFGSLLLISLSIIYKS